MESQGNEEADIDSWDYFQAEQRLPGIKNAADIKTGMGAKGSVFEG